MPWQAPVRADLRLTARLPPVAKRRFRPDLRVRRDHQALTVPATSFRADVRQRPEAARSSVRAAPQTATALGLRSKDRAEFLAPQPHVASARRRTGPLRGCRWLP